MTKIKIKKAKTKTPGVRSVKRTYADGREVLRYEVRLTDAAGETVNAGTYERYAEAVAARDAKRQAMRDGKFVSGSAGRRRLIEVAEEWMSSAAFKDTKANTQHTNRLMVNARLASLHGIWIDRFTTKTADDFMASLADAGLSPASRTRYLWILKAVLDYAVRAQYLGTNPAASLKRPKAKKYDVTVPENEDVRALLRVLRERDDERSLLFVELAVHTGMRAGELCGLRVRRLDLKRREVTVRETIVDVGGQLSSGTPKSEAGYRVIHDLDEGLCQRLRAFTSSMVADDYVFGQRGRDGSWQPLRYGNWDGRVFDKVRISAGLPNLRFHDLRHYHASLLIEGGLSVVAVAERLGHHSPTVTTEVYAHQFRRREGDDRASAAIEAALAEPTADNVVPITQATA